MRLPHLFTALCCGVIFLSSCKKDEKDNSNTSVQKQTLVAGKWQMSAGTATTNYMGKDTTIDIYSLQDECDKDDFILFAITGTGTIDENINKCAGDQQIENFTWVLLNSDTRLALIDSNPDTTDIVEITSLQLKLKQTKPNSSGTPVTTIRTYKNIK
jgi:hypothetical protein